MKRSGYFQYLFSVVVVAGWTSIWFHLTAQVDILSLNESIDWLLSYELNKSNAGILVFYSQVVCRVSYIHIGGEEFRYWELKTVENFSALDVHNLCLEMVVQKWASTVEWEIFINPKVWVDGKQERTVWEVSNPEVI